MSLSTHHHDTPNDEAVLLPANGDHVALTVMDHLDARPELKQFLQLNGYHVIDTDNGQDAASNAREIRPDLLVVDMDVPLIYGLVAARQIIKRARLGPLPVVIVTREEVLDLAPVTEVGASRDEYVTRLSDYQQLQNLLDYLWPVLPDNLPSTTDAPLELQRRCDAGPSLL